MVLWNYNPLAGPLSIVLSWFDLESPRWFKENWLVIFAICTIIGWKVFGYNLIVMLAAMLAVPKEMIEAAKLENASNWQIFKQIIVPMTSSTAIYVFTITVVFGLQYVLVPVNMLRRAGLTRAAPTWCTSFTSMRLYSSRPANPQPLPSSR